jgi:hypothetical protein
MNKLVQYLKDKRLNETSAMNLLQDIGIISDNAVYAAEVCDDDAEKAVKHLKSVLGFKE